MSVVIVGGGPAGMMAAIAAASRGRKVVLIEKNDRPGRKMYISGKGRCNITNNTDIKSFLNEVVSNPKFLMAALYAFPPSAAMEFFESNGLPLKTERGDRVFPASDKSADVIDLMRNLLKEKGVKLVASETVKRLEKVGEIITKVVTDKSEYPCEAVLLATGGISYPKTGSTGDGYLFAKELGHTIIEPKPALCPVLLKGAYDTAGKLIGYNELPFPQGLSLKNVEAKIIKKDNSPLYKEFGEMLFTDKGVSGPCVLSLSSRINRAVFSDIMFSIDLKPALDEKTLDARILRDFGEAPNRQFKNSLSELLPKSLIPYIVALSCIDPDKPINAISKAERKGLLGLLKNLRFSIEGLEGFDQAIVTAGGVSVKEVNPSTMASKLVKNLYFAGEILDVDALTGGYNIQIALSTGYLAGKNI